MALRINNNVSALRSLRSLNETDRKLAESLERLSSGFRINKGADSPAGLIISEQMRGQIAGINQAINNTELATAMVQTSEGALTTVNSLLIRMRELALHAANEGANDSRAVEADQIEIDSGLDTINRIAATAQFGTRRLLDGSSGVTGKALGDGLLLLSASERTKSSPVRGYDVEVTQAPTRAFMEGGTAITENNLPGLSISLFEGGKSVQVTADESDSVASYYGRLSEAVREQNLALDLDLSDDGVLSVVHQNFGSEYGFEGSSSVGGVLSEQADAAESAVLGQDIQGTIAGEAALGNGQVLRGVPGNDKTEGIAVKYLGSLVEVPGETPEDPSVLERQLQTGIVGAVNISNNAPTFQVGPNIGQRISVALPETSANALAREVENLSGFQSLRDVDVRTPQGAQDAVRLVDAAIDEMTQVRGKLGAFQKNSLESNLAQLRVTAENLIAAESTIRDADFAKELTEFTKNKILFDTSSAMLAQANQIPRTVIDLIR